MANGHFFFTLTVSYVQEEARYRCIAYKLLEVFTKKFVPLLDIILLSFLPFSIMTTCNIIIIWKLKQMAMIRKRMKANAPKSNRKLPLKVTESHNRFRRKYSAPFPKDSSRKESKREASLTMMLLTVNIFFIVSTLPITVLNTLWELNVDLLTDNQKAIVNQFQSIGSSLLYLNITFHFLLFIFSGKIFRTEFVKLCESIPFISYCAQTLCCRWVLCISRTGSMDVLDPSNRAYPNSCKRSSEPLLTPLPARLDFRRASVPQFRIPTVQEIAFDPDPSFASILE